MGIGAGVGLGLTLLLTLTLLSTIGAGLGTTTLLLLFTLFKTLLVLLPVFLVGFLLELSLALFRDAAVFLLLTGPLLLRAIINTLLYYNL